MTDITADDFPAAPSADAALSRTSTSGTLRDLPFEFRGNASEFFGIWIVNLLLSVLTLGIYSAWAKVRTKRYFYGNTFVDDSAFEYRATLTPWHALLPSGVEIELLPLDDHHRPPMSRDFLLLRSQRIAK